MNRYVIFLRGVNVGGHNVVKKEDLKKAFTSLGLKNVSTYKQSGNIVFDTETHPDAIKKKIQKKLGSLLNREVGIFILALDKIEGIVASDPFMRINEPKTSCWVTFMSKVPELRFKMPMNIPRADAEVIYVRDNIAYSVTRGYGDGGRPTPFIESKYNVQATTRSWAILNGIVETYWKRA